ncbi:hypothetical protein EDD21DRAFT_155542 [Dissophora ornata]|nr:hypothetical protein EDD21DRAFT_155542 [Dissophora ornata]
MRSVHRFKPFARPPVPATTQTGSFTPPSLSLANSALVLIEEYLQQLSLQEHVEDYSMTATVTEINVAQDSSAVATTIGELDGGASSWEYTMTPFDDAATLLLPEQLRASYSTLSSHNIGHCTNGVVGVLVVVLIASPSSGGGLPSSTATTRAVYVNKQQKQRRRRPLPIPFSSYCRKEKKKKAWPSVRSYHSFNALKTAHPAAPK